MADMFDCGAHQFRSWASGETHSVRWYGQFDPNRTANEQWVISDCEGKLNASAFAPFERGWNAAKAEFMQHQKVVVACKPKQ